MFDIPRADRKRIRDLQKVAGILLWFKKKYPDSSIHLEAIGIYDTESLFRYIESNKEKK